LRERGNRVLVPLLALGAPELVAMTVSSDRYQPGLCGVGRAIARPAFKGALDRVVNCVFRVREALREGESLSEHSGVEAPQLLGGP
jgi:hypothetical protein